MLARWMNMVLGAWLIVAPWMLGFREQIAQRNALWVGLAVIIVAIVAMFWPLTRFLNTALGAWLFASPFALSYESDRWMTWNALAVGALTLVFSLVPTLAALPEAGGVPRKMARP